MVPTHFGHNRYHRQMLLPGIGPEGQQRLAAARVLLVGCGALGTVIAEQLVRAGVGFLRIADRDIIELTNLQRQVLFDEQDMAAGLPKAIAAEQRLRRINSSVAIEANVVDVHAGNIEGLAQGSHLILDGTDNVETRYLINDLAIKLGIPWVYGAVVGTEGRVMPILPGRSPCLRCVFPQPPGPGELATCDTAGVLGPAVGVVASLQAAAAIKLLTGNDSAIAQEMTTLDLWSNRLLAISMVGARREDCPTCGQRRFEWLESPRGSGAVSLCGRRAVQIRGDGRSLELDPMAERLGPFGVVRRTPYFVRCELRDPAGMVLTVFPDGRLIVHGTDDTGRARSIAARYLGA